MKYLKISINVTVVYSDEEYNAELKAIEKYEALNGGTSASKILDSELKDFLHRELFPDEYAHIELSSEFVDEI